VLLAAAGVFFTRTIWPDIIVGLAITALFLRSSVHVLRQATNELRATSAGANVVRSLRERKSSRGA
jgi:Co/Zn/Cd efflux system component